MEVSGDLLLHGDRLHAQLYADHHCLLHLRHNSNLCQSTTSLINITKTQFVSLFLRSQVLLSFAHNGDGVSTITLVQHGCQRLQSAKCNVKCATTVCSVVSNLHQSATWVSPFAV